MKGIPVVLTVLSMSILVLATPRAAQGWSCDGYGNCLSSNVSYTRSNPDLTLYPGDQFMVSLQIYRATNTSSYSVTWNYDAAALKGQPGSASASFTLEENATSQISFGITASINFVVNICTQGKCTLTSSVLMTNQTVVAVPLVLQLHLNQVNVTSRGHQLRNPDGTFYPYDEFVEKWNASFRFSEARKDISINVTSSGPSTLGKRLLLNFTVA